MLQLEWVCRNVVATFELRLPICLRTVALRSANCEYNPRRFTAAILRLRRPRVTVLLFSSGKCVVVGGKSVRDARCGATQIAQLISSLFSACAVNAFEVRNMVFTASTPFRLRIDALYEHMRRLRCFHRCFYDPICFPGIRCSVHPGKSPSLLIFATGRVICSGLKHPLDVLDIGNIFMPFVETYKSCGLQNAVTENK